MDIIITILAVIAILAILLLIAALLRKKEYSIKREISIQRPGAEVFHYVKFLKNQDFYSKWVMMDPHLKKDFKVLYNKDLQLYTIRHYFPSTIEKLANGRDILLEQRSRTTAQLVMKQMED